MRLNGNSRNRACAHFHQGCPTTELFISPTVPRGGCIEIRFIFIFISSASASSSSISSSRPSISISSISISKPSPSPSSKFSFSFVYSSSSSSSSVRFPTLTMPRPKKAGGPEPKRRSRNGCWSVWQRPCSARALTVYRPCKTRKIKCGEEKPKCHHCERQGETCDYSIRLNWEGRTKRKSTDFMQEPAQTPTAVTGGPRPGLVPRPLSEPAFGGLPVLGAASNSKSQIPPGLSDSSSEFLPTQKTGIIRDVYSLEATSKSHIIPVSPYEASSFGPRANPKIITDLRPHHEGRLVASGEDELARTTIADMSFVGMHGGQQLSSRDHISASQLSRIRDPSSASYPSPTDSSLDSPPLSALQSLNFSKDQRYSPSTSHMPPPPQSNRPAPLFFGDIGRNQEALPIAGQHTPKRLRMSPPREFSDPSQRYRSTSYSSYHGGGSLQAMPSSPSQHMSSFRPYSPSDTYGQTPFSSAVSSMRSRGNQLSSTVKASAQGREESPDRRLSVSSLLADPVGGNEMGIGPGKEPSYPAAPYSQTPFQDLIVNYGLDRGFPDMDLPTNNDDLALNGITPTITTAGYNILKSEDAADESNNHSEFGFGLNASNSAHGERGYYAKPVPVAIPRSLGHLPATLQENPMNLLYFHHFLNHTARILVPHDCSENPFKSILPQSKLPTT